MVISAQPSISSLLPPYQQKINIHLNNAIPSFGPPSLLRDACAYALQTGGKRFRPALVLLIAEALKKGFDATEAALAIEYFHTASLIADDLPCMDNDAERRGEPATHIIYGEATALLASYALISAGYDAIARCAAQLPPKDVAIALQKAIEKAAFCTGIHGATGGQYVDLFPDEITEEKARKVLEQKTVSLFAIAFLFGWIFGGGDLAALPLVEEAAHHFGMAFQIADDIEDADQDRQNGRTMNMALLLGKERALQEVAQEKELFGKAIEKLGLESLQKIV